MTDVNLLIEQARQVRTQAYAPYSNFLVGAALQTRDGTMFTGCNVENGSYGLAICAERSAICTAVAAGHRDFDTIVIAAAPLATPCGACRQFLVEFSAQIRVICVDADQPDRRKSWLVNDLIPDAFGGP